MKDEKTNTPEGGKTGRAFGQAFKCGCCGLPTATARYAIASHDRKMFIWVTTLDKREETSLIDMFQSLDWEECFICPKCETL